MRISEGKAGDTVVLEEPLLVVRHYRVSTGSPVLTDGTTGEEYVIVTAEGFDAMTRIPLTFVLAWPAAAVGEFVGELQKAVQE